MGFSVFIVSCVYIAVILTEEYISAQSASKMKDITEFFPGVKNDLSQITWAHAVNSKAELDEAMAGDVMMLEADVVLGTLRNGNNTQVPIMAHPPNNTSDLSLEQFISRVIREDKNKGVKLDFKSTEVLPESLSILKEHIDQIHFPVWLNADILPGPVDSRKTPVNPNTFLFSCRESFPTSTLSVGWTTKYGTDNGGNITSGSYSLAQTRGMRDALSHNHVTQPVTFPVRAGLAARSLGPLESLLGDVYGSTLTVWSAKDDVVDVELLRELIKKIGKDRIYVDVPDALKEQLNSGAAFFPVQYFSLLFAAVIHFLLLKKSS